MELVCTSYGRSDKNEIFSEQMKVVLAQTFWRGKLVFMEEFEGVLELEWSEFQWEVELTNSAMVEKVERWKLLLLELGF